MADEQLRDDVKQLLDNIDWNSVSEFENLRATVERNPQIAEQLAYGEMTDLVRATSKTITGQFSLRAIPNGEGKPWALRMYNIEKKPDPAKEDIYYKGSKITSPDILRGLFERTSWIGADGKQKHGYANANAGKPVGYRDQETGQIKYDIVSFHQPTNRLVGIPVDAVKNMFVDKETGEYRKRQIYGAEITPKQADALAEGKAVKIEGQTREGETFTTFVQFDAARRRVVPCHPAWLKEAEKAGVDLGIGNQSDHVGTACILQCAVLIKLVKYYLRVSFLLDLDNDTDHLITVGLVTQT